MKIQIPVNLVLKTMLVSGALGIAVDMYHDAHRQPFEPVTSYSVIWYFGILAFWAILWCITPSKWWKL